MQVPADGAASKQHGNELKTAHAEQQAQRNRSRVVLEAANDWRLLSIMPVRHAGRVPEKAQGSGS